MVAKYNPSKKNWENMIVKKPNRVRPRFAARSLSVRIARAAVIAAIYAALCFATVPTSYGVMQLRFAEALSLLPLVMPEAIAGLTVGCVLANIMSVPLDIGLGALATLLAASSTYLIGRLFRHKVLRVLIGALPPILFNALLVPVVLLAAGWNVAGGAELGYFACAGFVALGQTICVAGLGIPLILGVSKTFFRFGKKRKPIEPPDPETTQAKLSDFQTKKDPELADPGMTKERGFPDSETTPEPTEPETLKERAFFDQGIPQERRLSRSEFTPQSSQTETTKEPERETGSKGE